MVNLGTENEKNKVNISSSLDSLAKKEIVDLLKKYTDIFAWSYQDMSGLSIEIVEPLVAYEARMQASSAKASKGKTRNAFED